MRRRKGIPKKSRTNYMKGILLARNFDIEDVVEIRRVNTATGVKRKNPIIVTERERRSYYLARKRNS